ncbi:hypothetical protein JCM14036_05500 [Desulfotomaculum defluvii]
MKLEAGQITQSQLIPLMMSFILGTTIVISPARGAGHDAWLAYLLGMIEAMVFALIYLL